MRLRHAISGLLIEVAVRLASCGRQLRVRDEQEREDDILRMLAHGPKTGLELVTGRDHDSGMAFRARRDPARSETYVTLRRLESQGVLTYEDGRKRGADNRIYRLTPTGIADVRWRA